MEHADIRHVAVIGTGTIGASWAAYFMSRGLSVAASDPAPQAESTLRRFVAASWPALVRLGAPQPLPDKVPEDRLSFHTEPEAALAGVDFVQENAPERVEVKRALLARLDAALPPEVIIASSSSGLLMSRLQADCRHPERCVIGHPFNPPHLVPLVEVVAGNDTAPATVERALAFYAAIGKRPIHIRREVPGHVANRLQAALWREAVHLVAEGIATVADIDTAISDGPGVRWALMGPHLTFHLAGGSGGIGHFLDQFAGPMEAWWETLVSPTSPPRSAARLPPGLRRRRRAARSTSWRQSATAGWSKSWPSNVWLRVTPDSGSIRSPYRPASSKTGHSRSISETQPSAATTRSDLATELISRTASLSRFPARADPRQP